MYFSIMLFRFKDGKTKTNLCYCLYLMDVFRVRVYKYAVLAPRDVRYFVMFQSFHYYNLC